MSPYEPRVASYEDALRQIFNFLLSLCDSVFQRYDVKIEYTKDELDNIHSLCLTH